MHKFLHLADIHFDTSFLCRSDQLRSRLRKELQAAFRRAIDFAISEGVVAVLIAGDLLDDKQLSMGTEQFLLEQLYRLDEAQIPCIYVAGHSDAADSTSRTHEIDWPASLLHFKERSPKIVELQDLDGSPIARIVGAGHEARKEEENLAMQFPEATGRVPHIGLLHTAVLGAGGDGELSVAPSHIRELKAAGYVYWALGHQHACRRLDARSHIWYSGCLTGVSAGETGAKGGLLVTIGGYQVLDVTFKAFSSVRWYRLDLNDLEEVRHVNDLIHRLERAFAENSEESESISLQLVQVRLSGMCPMAEELQDESRRQAIEEQIAQHLNVDEVELRVDDVIRFVEIDAYRDKAHLLSEVLRVIDDVAENHELLDELLPDLLAVQAPSEDDRRAYLSGLLGGLDSEAVVRLTDEVNHAH